MSTCKVGDTVTYRFNDDPEIVMTGVIQEDYSNEEEDDIEAYIITGPTNDGGETNYWVYPSWIIEPN